MEVLDILGYLLHVHHETFTNIPFTRQKCSLRHSSPMSSVICKFSLITRLLSLGVFAQSSKPCLSSRHFIPHRVGVLNIKGEISQVITQTDLAGFASQNISTFPKLVQYKSKIYQIRRQPWLRTGLKLQKHVCWLWCWMLLNYSRIEFMDSPCRWSIQTAVFCKRNKIWTSRSNQNRWEWHLWTCSK